MSHHLTHVSCAGCGAIFHPEDLDEEGLCEECSPAATEPAVEDTGSTPPPDEDQAP